MATPAKRDHHLPKSYGFTHPVDCLSTMMQDQHHRACRYHYLSLVAVIITALKKAHALLALSQNLVFWYAVIHSSCVLRHGPGFAQPCLG